MPQAQDQSQTWNPSTAVNPRRDPLGSHPDLIDPDLKVSQAMTVAPRTCSPMSMVIEAVLIFRDADCGVVPITDAEIPVGVLTDRDVALALPNHENDLARTPVGELMSKDVVTIGLDDSLELALEKLGDHGVRRLLVVDGEGFLQGILSWADLAPHLTPTALGRVVSRIVENR
jgi:CBS domain-containing protein